MLRICIVDDHKKFVDKCEKIIDCFPMDEQYKVYKTIYGLDEKIWEAPYDLYILDVQMPSINGFELATSIQAKYKDAKFIFVSAYNNFVYQSFMFHVFYFVRKDHLEQDLIQALQRFLACEEPQRGMYMFEKKDLIQYIPFHEILYFEKINNEMYVHKTDGEVLCHRKNMVGLLKSIPLTHFCLTCPGICVNLRYVKRISKYKVVMENEKYLEVSRRKWKDVKQRFSMYFLECEI